jgi:uncharacterized protein (DUF1778 family)
MRKVSGDFLSVCERIFGGTPASLDLRPAYCQCKYMPIMKDDRLQLRVDAASKRRLEEAASEAHLSVSAFVLQAANQAADNLLAERQTIHLSPNAAAAFTEALNRPARVNERLAAALEHAQKFGWLD